MDQEYLNNIYKTNRLNKQKRHLTEQLTNLLDEYVELSEFGLIFVEETLYSQEIFLINRKKELGLVTIRKSSKEKEVEVSFNEGTIEDLGSDLITTCAFLEKSISKNILRDKHIKDLPEVVAWFTKAALQEDNEQFSVAKKKTL